MFIKNLMQSILKIKKLLEILRQDDIIIPEWLFKEQTPIIKKNLKKYLTLKH